MVSKHWETVHAFPPTLYNKYTHFVMLLLFSLNLFVDFVFFDNIFDDNLFENLLRVSTFDISPNW